MAPVAHQAFLAAPAMGGRPRIGGAVAVAAAVEANAPVILSACGVELGRILRTSVLAAAARADALEAPVAAPAPRA